MIFPTFLQLQYVPLIDELCLLGLRFVAALLLVTGDVLPNRSSNISSLLLDVAAADGLGRDPCLLLECALVGGEFCGGSNQSS